MWDGSDSYAVKSSSPILSLFTWIHVGITYSFTNGLRLFVNGIMVNVTSPGYAYSASGDRNRITIGTCVYPANCRVGFTKIVPSQFLGKIDEMRVYSRELSIGEMNALANP
jgi:hypothetical protein